MVKAEFMELYEELNNLNEDTVSEAALLQKVIDALKAAGRDDLVAELAGKELIRQETPEEAAKAAKETDDIVQSWN